MELPEELQERVDIIRHKLKFIEQKPTVACVTVLGSSIASDQFAEAVAIAGGNAILGQVLQQNPDIIIVIPAGYTIEQTIKQVDQFLQLPGFAELKAVQNNRFYIADGKSYFNQHNWVDSIEILAEIINPKQFIFGYEGEGWIRFEI